MRGFAAHPCLRRFQKGKTRSRRCYFNAFTRLYITLFAIHDSAKCAGANLIETSMLHGLTTQQSFPIIVLLFSSSLLTFKNKLFSYLYSYCVLKQDLMNKV